MNALTKLENATKMLAEVRDAHEAKNLMAMASAAEHYAKKAKLGQEAIDYAHAIKIDAERLLGGYLKAAEKAEGQTHGGRKTKLGGTREVPPNAPPTLSDLGLSKKLSSEAQALHTIAETNPEQFGAIRSGEKTVTAVRREAQRAKVSEVAALPNSKYRVIYADPPWKYGDQLTEDYGPTKFHYPAMSISELCALPIVDLCEDSAVLFLWVTSPLLEECFRVIAEWGFSYKSSFVWDKIKHNMGHYNSVRHEFLLICTRGSCLPDVPELIDSVQSIERTKHSTKPEEFRTIIDKLYLRGKRIELFARTEAKGWDRWGNQA